MYVPVSLKTAIKSKADWLYVWELADSSAFSFENVAFEWQLGQINLASQSFLKSSRITDPLFSEVGHCNMDVLKIKLNINIDLNFSFLF